jgi:hypothetical protein
MMQITDVRAHHIRIPYDAGPASFRQGASAITALDMVLVEVLTDAASPAGAMPSLTSVLRPPAPRLRR